MINLNRLDSDPAPKKKRHWLLGAGVVVVLIAAAGACTGTPEDAAPVSDPASTSAPAPTKPLAAETPKANQQVPLPTPAAEPPAAAMTASQEQALRKARSYIETMPFSAPELVEQLVYNKFSAADAKFAVARMTDVDWNEQAALKAKSYLNAMPLSAGELYDQLIYNKFTPAQAKYGVKAAGL